MFQQSEFVAHASVVTCLSIGNLSQNIFATGGEDCVVHVWNSEAKNIWKLNGNKTPIECVCFNPNEEYVASGSRSGSIKIFDISEGKVARNLRGHPTTTNSLFYHPHADILLSGSFDTQVKAWDLRNKECLMTCPGHEKQITCVRFSPDGRWLVTAGQDGKVIFWDVVAGKVINTIKCTTGSYALQMEFSPTELYLAVSTSARVVVVYDCEDNFECICTTPAESSQIRRICFSDQGRTLHVASDGNLRVYELPNNQYYRGITDGGVAEFSCVQSYKVAWDKVSDMKLNEHNFMLAGSFNANFVCLSSADMSKVCGESGSGENDDYTADSAAGHYESKATPDRTPDRVRELPSSKPKPVPSSHARLTTASDSKITADEQDEEDFIYGNSHGHGRVDAESKAAGRYGRAEDDAKGGFDEGGDYIDAANVGVNKLRISPVKKADPTKNTPPPHSARDRDRGSSSSHGKPNKVTPTSASKYRHASANAEAKGGEQRVLNFEEMAIVGNKHRNPVVNDHRPSHEVAAAVEAPVPSLNINGGRELRSRGGNYKRRADVDDIASGADDNNAALTATIPLLGKLLDNYIDDGREFSSKLSHRMSSLRILQNYWNAGDVAQVMNEVQLMYESNRALTLTCRNSLQGNMLKQAQERDKGKGKTPGNYVLDEDSHQLLVHESKQPIMIIADFLTSVGGLRELINVPPTAAGAVGQGLTLDICVNILPILDNMLNDSSLEHVIRASVITTAVLVEAFGEVISSTRRNMSVAGGNNRPVAGVDLSREERIHKCNQCYVELNKINTRIRSLKRSANSTSSSGHSHSSAGAGRKYNVATMHDLSRLESRLADIIVT